MYELQLLDDAGTPEVRVPLGTLPLYVGRAAHNHLVVAHPSVSGRHASLFVQGEQVWLEDLNSSNGTTVDGQDVQGRTPIAVGQVVRLGEARSLRVVDVGSQRASDPAGRRWVVRPSDGGAGRAVDRERFRIGPDTSADLRTDDGPGCILLLSPTTGELALADGDEERPLSAGDVLEIGGERLTVELADPGVAATIRVIRHAYPYTVEVQSDPAAPSVLVRDPDGAVCRVTAPNRVALLTVLAMRLAEEQRSDDPNPTERGWVADEDVAIGIWGRAGRARPIKVVLCRTRAQLRKAGLDGWCLEKRGAATRLRAREVKVAHSLT